MKDVIHIQICKMLFHHTGEMFYPGYLKENREDSQSFTICNNPSFHKKCHINSPHHDATIKYDLWSEQNPHIWKRSQLTKPFLLRGYENEKSQYLQKVHICRWPRVTRSYLQSTNILVTFH